MNRWLRVGALWLVLATVLLPRLSVFAADGKVVSTGRLLPPEVAVYVSVPDVEELKARWAKTAMSSLTQDSTFEPFKQEILKAFEGASGKLEEELGVSLKALLQVPSGEFAFAVLAPQGKKLSAVMFLDFGDNDKTVDTLLEKAEKALEDNGAESEDEEIGGTKVTTWTFKGGDPQQPNKLVYFIKDTMLVISSDLNTAKGVLTRWDGKHSDTFADNDNYNLILDKCQTDDEDGLFVWYINPIGLLQAGLAQAAAQNPQLALAGVFLEPLGLFSLKAIGGSADMATEQFDSVTKTFLVIEQPTKGVMNLFQFPAVEQKPPKWVSSNASAWFAVNWDISEAYQAASRLFAMIPNAPPGGLDSLVDNLAEQEPRVHLKKDVIDSLSGRVQVVVEPAKKKDENGQDRVVVAIGLNDAKKFQATLTKITKTPGFPGKTREFKGATIIEFEVPDLSGGLEPKMAGLAIGKEQLMFSNDVTAVESMLRGDTDGDALVDSAEYKAIAEHIPAKSSIVSFSRSDSQMETLWELAKGGQAGLLLPMIDFEKLPSFDSVKKYLTPNGGYAVPEKKGVLFVSFGTKKK
jgi:hypothetical protein